MSAAESAAKSASMPATTSAANSDQQAAGSAAQNSALVHRFYQAFAALDAGTMADCYAPDVRFDDPIFTLEGRTAVAGMWGMLCEAVKARGRGDWDLAHAKVVCEGNTASAQWQARYRFSATGRLVENRIVTRLRFDAAGRIAEHHDSFDFWRWSRQALGPAGLLLGWTPLLRHRVRAQARRNLDRYLAH